MEPKQYTNVRLEKQFVNEVRAVAKKELRTIASILKLAIEVYKKK